MDITKCVNIRCKLKGKCLRFLAKDSPYNQNYVPFNCTKENGYKNYILPKKYKVETVDKGNSFSKICFESALTETKQLVKECSGGSRCYYREYPLTKNKKIYF